MTQPEYKPKIRRCFAANSGAFYWGVVNEPPRASWTGGQRMEDIQRYRAACRYCTTLNATAYHAQRGRVL